MHTEGHIVTFMTHKTDFLLQTESVLGLFASRNADAPGDDPARFADDHSVSVSDDTCDVKKWRSKINVRGISVSLTRRLTPSLGAKTVKMTRERPKKKN